MPRRLVGWGALAVLLVLSASACFGGDAEPEAEAAPTASAPREITPDDYDPSLFDETSITIDNEWWPLKPGKQFTWTGSSQEGDEEIPHEIVFTVTDLTKVIDGVRTVVGWERDFSDDALVEAELIFLAQDRFGNVWHFGQYSETYEDEELVGGLSWLVGHLEGAKAGIMMQADPRAGTPAYRQGFAPEPYFWDDFGKVDAVGRETCVPADCYDDVLVIDEHEPTKPNAHQLKYYARGVGQVRTGWRGEDADREELVLESVETLSAEQLAEARDEALGLEARGRVYGSAPPAEPRAGTGD